MSVLSVCVCMGGWMDGCVCVFFWQYRYSRDGPAVLGLVTEL